MKYTKEQLDAIEKVKTVFSDYIKNSKTLDLIWSDKLGYILITGITKDMNNFVMQPEVLYTAERLCDQLLYMVPSVQLRKDLLQLYLIISLQLLQSLHLLKRMPLIFYS